jgi:Cft2 family RNA processing exonuclease
MVVVHLDTPSVAIIVCQVLGLDMPLNAGVVVVHLDTTLAAITVLPHQMIRERRFIEMVVAARSDIPSVVITVFQVNRRVVRSFKNRA